MQVEEDPSSRFVDYTNATVFEKFTSEIEDVLLKWDLTDKGISTCKDSKVDEVKFDTVVYKLHLVCLSPDEMENTITSSPIWSDGMKHFTPTLLSMANRSNDFSWGDQAKKDYFVRWFGISQYLLLTHQNESSDLLGYVSPSEANLLLSALCIALGNNNCSIPAFVPSNEPSRQMYIGCSVPGGASSASIRFETDQVPELTPNAEEPLDHHYASSSENICNRGMWVSVAFKYHWDLSLVDERQVVGISIFQGDDIAMINLENNDFQSSIDWRHGDQFMIRNQCDEALVALHSSSGSGDCLLWGPEQNPICAIVLRLIWKDMREGSYVDNAVHSTLDPMDAPIWRISALWNPIKENLPLSAMIKHMSSALFQANELGSGILVSELCPSFFNTPSPSSSSYSGYIASETVPAVRAAVVISSALETLTQSIVKATTNKESLTLEMADEILNSLFDTEGVESSSTFSEVHRSVPVGGMLSLLALKMCDLHGISAMCLLWVEFVKRLRQCWEDATFIGVDRMNSADDLSSLMNLKCPLPDLNCSLLYQKLQMLNCCILRRKQLRAQHDFHHHQHPKESSTVTNLKDGWGDDDDDNLSFSNESEDEQNEQNEQNTKKNKKTNLSNSLEKYANKEEEEEEEEEVANESENESELDEFFDSVEGPSSTTTPPHSVLDHQENISHSNSERSNIGFQSFSSGLDSGLERPNAGFQSLVSGLEIIEPLTHETVPLTEDMIFQQQEILSRLGCTAEAGRIRQQLQSASLHSDMQAFKAANPNCVLADFVRWHSPKDWISWEKIEPELLESVEKEAAESSRCTGDQDEDESRWFWKGKGILSKRMREIDNTDATHGGSTNMWKRTWRKALPVPVSRQRPLFDASQEAEKVFHYLETMAPVELFRQMLIAMCSTSYYSFSRSPSVLVELPQIKRLLEGLLENAKDVVESLDVLSTLQSKTVLDDETKLAMARSDSVIESFSENMKEVEIAMTHATSLLDRFPQQYALVNRIIESNGETTFVEKEERTLICSLLSNNDNEEEETSLKQTKTLPEPVSREYILRCTNPRPFHVPQHLPSETHCVVSRMYGCFTEETVRFAIGLTDTEF